MLLQALVNYYKILSEDEGADIPKQGYSKANISYVLVISKGGELVSVLPLKNPDSKTKQEMEVPEQVKRASAIFANFLCDNSSYVLGFDNKGKPERSKDCFLAFKALHEKILKGLECEEAKAVLRFLENWDSEAAVNHPELTDYIDDIYRGANFIFKLDGAMEYVHQNSLIKKAWEKYKASLSDGSGTGRCLVTGEQGPVARLHPVIKGIKGGQAMGNSLVSFNAPAYQSYEKEQGMNSTVSEYAAFAYGTVLNRMLSDNAHKLSLGDSTVVFWAESKQNSLYQDIFSLFVEPDELQTIGTDKQKYVRDDNAVKNVKSIFKKISAGEKISRDFSVDEDTNFYILGLSPNAARISVRFFLCNTFGVFMDRLTEHYESLAIDKQFENEPDSISFWKMLNETVSPASKDKSASPLISGELLRLVLTGSAYPAALFNAVMIRIRAEKDINYYKAAIIKAYLSKRLNKNTDKEVLIMSHNPTTKNKAYVLGRLFAVLEQTQKNANTTALNTTIKDRYFTSACANPSLTFPVLLKLSNHHISKTDHGKFDEAKIAKIMLLLNVEEDPFPKSLSLEDQGIFVLGYYHQKSKLFEAIKEAAQAKKTKESEEE